MAFQDTFPHMNVGDHHNPHQIFYTTKIESP